MTGTTMIHVRMDSETKNQAKQALDEMGLSVSEAVRLFFHRIAREKALPFAIDVPNAETRAAILDARRRSAEMLAEIEAGKPPRFKTPEEMFAVLNAGIKEDGE